MTTLLPLTKGRVALIDDADLARVSHLSWCFARNGYAIHYDNSLGHRQNIFLHRLLLNAPPGLKVDHINRDKLDNRRVNLRFATRSQNGANKGIAVSNTSGYKGVSFNQGKWEARIRVEQRRIHLGRYESALEAALTYDAAARLFNGDFAGLNFPDVPTPEPQRLHLERLLEKRPGVRAHLERVGRLYTF